MLAVMEKIGTSNVLVGYDLFDTLGMKVPRSQTAKDPDIGGAERYARLEELAGWVPSTLQASVHAAYRTPGTRPVDTVELLATRAPFVRFCPICAEMGVHLALFQVSELLLCPIHETALEERCPRCLRPLRHYAFTLDDLAAIGCGSCDWEKRLSEPAGTNDALRTEKRAVVEGLVHWTANLRALIGADDASIRELFAPGSVRPLTHYHALVPGPGWIEQCMHAGSRTRMRVVSLQNVRSRRSRCPEPLAADDPTLSTNQLEVVTAERARRMERRLIKAFGLANPRDGAFLSTTGYRRRLVDDEANIAALAFRWWRRFLSPFPLEHVPLEHCTPVPVHPGSVPLWELWEEIHTGPRGVLRATALPDDVIPSLMARWTDLFLGALYLSLIGRASLFSCGQVEPGGVLRAAEQTGSMPLLVLRIGSRYSELVEVTNVAPETDFVALFRSGYSGFEEERLTEAFWTDPVHQLIALPAKEQRRSTEDLHQLAGRPERR